jgi:hypothetical protein
MICSNAGAQEITFARPVADRSISVSANHATKFRVGSYEVLHLHGGVRIRQARITATADEAIVWVEIPDSLEPGAPAQPYKVIVYLESDVLIEIRDLAGNAADSIRDDVWLGRLFTSASVDLSVRAEALGDNERPEIFRRAQMALEQGVNASVQQVQFQTAQSQMLISPQTGQLEQVPNLQPPDATFVEPTIPQNPPQQVLGLAAPSGGGSVPQTRINFSGRDSAADFNGSYQTNPNNPSERYFIGTGGVRVTIDSPEIARLEQFRTDTEKQIIILADNVVGWQTTLADGSTRWEMYLEGNVIFAKDKRIIYAKRMYYDPNFQQGTILDAEILTPVQKFKGLVRLKADVIQQVDANNLQAYGTAVTSSRMGVPRYWLQSEAVGLNRRQVPATDPDTGRPVFDAAGVQETDSEYFLEANQTRVYAGGVPVFAWPRMRMSLDDPSFYLNRFTVGNDNIFGVQVLTGWDMYQLLGIRNPPKGSTWTGILDGLSKRGIGFGSELEYQRDELFGIPGPVSGFYRGWFIHDTGLDQLGRGLFNLTPEETDRGRILARHQHQFAPGFQLKAELGYISDRNFLNQYFEKEWDQNKDAITGLWLQRNVDTQSLNLWGNYRINDFFTQTSWLPRFDQFVLGQPLARDRLVWYAHNQIGYGQLRVGDPPLNAAQAAAFAPLPWQADVQGLRTGTRQEIDLPVQLGPVKVIPYALGDAMYWQEALDGNDLFRVYGQAGVKASLPFWRVDPTIQSVLWNVNGLAHKVSIDVDAFYADASQDLDELALYDPLDDNAQEQSRSRFAFTTFGGVTPLEYDERFYALRSAMQGNVTAPSAEIADDLEMVTLGLRQRWQTKRGMPGQERIIDWITLDAQTAYYPKANRDDFGSNFGMLDYDFRWYVGDRFSVLSDGYFDFFGQGLRTASLGVQAGRPEVGNVFLGVRSIEGPISSNIMTISGAYRMSDKWGVTGISQFDFSQTGSIGNAINFIYIGESFLWKFGYTADFARENFGVRFGFEPRFLARSRLFNPGGVAIGPAGARWLE